MPACCLLGKKLAIICGAVHPDTKEEFTVKDSRVAAYGQLLVQHSMRVQKGDRVLIRGDVGAAPLMEEVARFVWQAGAFPYQVG